MAFSNSTSWPYHCNCQLDLSCGVRIILKRFNQMLTYGDFLEGLPCSRSNATMVESFLEYFARQYFRAGIPILLLPYSTRNDLRVPGDSDVPDRPHLRPEWLPSVFCIAEFVSDTIINPGADDFVGSDLVVAWLQDEFAMPIDEKALAAIRLLDWHRHAADFVL